MMSWRRLIASTRHSPAPTRDGLPALSLGGAQLRPKRYASLNGGVDRAGMIDLPLLAPLIAVTFPMRLHHG